jgi:serine phosphatase RsbU (regulator of sigma subunit)/ligand-binding sensor domain-containing protein
MMNKRILFFLPTADQCILPFSRTCFLLVVYFLFLSPVHAQKTHESGLFDIRNYTSKEYNLVPQNFAIIQDPRGVLYFGNNSGILEYDGKNWSTILSPKESAIHSLTINRKGTIFVGGTGELGYLSPDASGKMQFHSLLDRVPSTDQNFAEIWKCFATPEGTVYFQASNKIFCWNGKSMQVWTAKTSFHLMFYLNGTIYIRQRDIGLMRLTNNDLELMQGGELFADTKVYFMLPFRKNQILMNTQGHGLYLMKPGVVADSLARLQTADQLTRVTPFHTQIDDFLASNQIYNCIPLNHQNFSIGTLGSGLTVIDSAGNLKEAISKKTGLQDAAIHGQFMDSQQKLWLATNNGISKVDINSPITRFNDQNGLEGTVQSIIRHKDNLYAATNLGVFRLMNQDHSSAEAINQAHFFKLPSLSSECWDLLSFDSKDQNKLLVASNLGISQIDGESSQLVVSGHASVMHRSIKDPSRVYIGWINGLSSIYYTGGKWVDEGLFGDLNVFVRSIDEDDQGALWLGHDGTGVTRVTCSFSKNKAEDVHVSRFSAADGLPDETVYIKTVSGHQYFATPVGLYLFKGDHFYPDGSLGNQFTRGQNGVFRIDADKKGNIWMVTLSPRDGKMEIGYRNKAEKSSSSWVKTPFMGISKSITLSLFHDEDGITWLGGPDGLFRFNLNIEKNYDLPYQTLVRKVTLGKDSVLFAGTYSDDSGFVSLPQPERLKPVLHYSFNSFTFQFAAPNFEEESATVYSFFLEGFDKQWSSWKNENKAVYTNLPEGHYYFRVKAQNMFGRESQEAVYEFTIMAPWYRTFWAYAGYLFFFIGFVYIAITISTRSLKNIIQERTAEVVKQKEEIELKNKDITDSINYAKRIQEAILPTAEAFKTLFPESFILYKPKDIVSGDFYWLTERNGVALVAAADCTGHGVPGAFTSMIGNALLNEIVNDKTILEPAKVLDELREGIIKALKQSGKEGESKDGMDISLCSIDLKKKELQYAGAYNSLFLIRNGQLTETKADKFPIGISDHNKRFTNHTIQLNAGDTLYIGSDGFADQFGGPDGKKFMRKRFKELLLSFQHLPLEEQRMVMNKSIVDWQGGNEQVDDILVIGIRV